MEKQAKIKDYKAIQIKTGIVIFCEGEQFIFGLNKNTGKPECLNLHGRSGIKDNEILKIS